MIQAKTMNHNQESNLDTPAANKSDPYEKSEILILKPRLISAKGQRNVVSGVN